MKLTSWELRTELLPWQAAGVAKLKATRIAGLFMAMGTGKTRTAIALVALRCGRIDRVVYFCPVALLTTIAYEWRKHTTLPADAIQIYTPACDRARLEQASVVIIGIETMSSSRRAVLAMHALITTQTFVIVDESSYIKGHRSLRTERITLLSEKARYRLVLTGTPISQGVQDLYAQMRFLSPKILGYYSFYSFAANHLEYSKRYPGMVVRAHNVGLLTAKIAPYVYQVTKEECMQLPEKLHTTRWCRLTRPQQAAYQRAKEEIFARIEAEDNPIRHIYLIFQLFNQLQQIACGFLHRPGGETQVFEHDRLSILGSVLDSLQHEPKVIIWAKYRHCIREIVDYLGRYDSPGCAVPFFGNLSLAERERNLAAFRAEARYLVATPSTGGHGLTLNEATGVVFYTNSFKYSERIQAEDRCHRIGQERHVTYVDVAAEQTIDTRILEALRQKQDLSTSFRQKLERIKDLRKSEISAALREMLAEL